jgi:hypothetical protein
MFGLALPDDVIAGGWMEQHDIGKARSTPARIVGVVGQPAIQKGRRDEFLHEITLGGTFVVLLGQAFWGREMNDGRRPSFLACAKQTGQLASWLTQAMTVMIRAMRMSIPEMV